MSVEASSRAIDVGGDQRRHRIVDPQEGPRVPEQTGVAMKKAMMARSMTMTAIWNRNAAGVRP